MADNISRKVQDFFSEYPTRSFEKGQIMVHAEEPPPCIFYLLEGRVNQYDISPSGINIVVNVFKPSAFFPVSWALNSEPNHYFFEAAEPTVVRIAPPQTVLEMLRNNPDITLDLLARVFRGMDGVLRRTAHLMGGDAKSRLLFELLNSASRFGKIQPGGGVFVPLKEGDIARQSGLARETVNRTLQRLKQDGCVTIERRGITIIDIVHLEALLGAAL